MAPIFGYGVLFISFGLAIYAIFAAIFGERTKNQAWIESARRAMLLTFPLITTSALTLIYLLVTNQFDVSFVYEVTSLSMPTYLKVTALWGGQAGSLLFWSWLMSSFATAVTLRKWDRDREFLPWVVVVCCITLAFFVGMVVFYENPFARYWSFNGEVIKAMFPLSGYQSMAGSIADGEGLNPLLRHPGMIIHPPMLYLGFVSFVIPFAFGIAALITGRTDDRWIRITRRWALVAWMFLTLGLVLGGRWAYDVLGWGGYWGWDPVEIAAFMPWLTGTAFVHSVMIQEKRGMLKHWNMLLIILTYTLVIFGTFLTRSGVLSSVHAFAQSAIGPVFFGYIAITLVVSVALLLHRWSELKSEMEMNSLLSRESLFLLNNLLFMGILVVCFTGVIYPLASELISGQKVTVGPPFYERATAPLFAGLLLLMGIAPLSAWGYSTYKTIGRAMWKPTLLAVVATIVMNIIGFRGIGSTIGFFLIFMSGFITIHEIWRGTRSRMKTSQENFFSALVRLISRNRRRYGGYLIHVGVVLMAIGIIGIEIFQTETQKTIAIGETIEISGYTLRYDSLSQFEHVDGRYVTRAVLSIFKDGVFIDELHPRYDMYSSGQPMTIPGVRSTLEDDLYVILVNWENVSSAAAPFKVYHNPLVNWMWIGTLVLLIGSFIAVYPDPEEELESARERGKAYVTVN